jgi:TRAP-type C4-dicarboxylate transport system permease small subunit
MAESKMLSLNEKLTKLNYACAAVAGYILLFVTLSIFVDVGLRYIFRRPSIWITEVSTYLFLYMIFLGTSFALQQGMHIKVTFLRFTLGPRAIRVLDFLCSVFAIIFCSVLLWQTSIMTWSSFKEKWTSPTMLNAPLRYIYVVMVFGSFLLLVTFIVETILQFTGNKSLADGGEKI